VFDIGFAELLLIGVVGLLVVGPEQLPGAVRTVLAWVNRFRRSFDQIRTEVRRELHNDEVLQKLKEESEQLERQVHDTTRSVEREIESLSSEARESLQPASPKTDQLSSATAADRLLRAVLAILVGFIVLFPFANEIYGFVSAPLRDLMPEGSTMIATGVASPFLTPFKLTLVLAIFMAIPVILYQIWGFIAPGLYKKEKRIAVPLLASSVLLFYAGAAFAYFVVFPLIFAFFTSVGPENVQVMTDINSYLDFVLKLFLAFGIAFEMPIAAVILIWTGVTSPDALAKKRPYIIVGCFIFGMLLTPPDVISQSLLAIPMWLLFELGVFFGRLLEPKTQTANSPAED
jgi:sec-independent protein translocase protein TatC